MPSGSALFDNCVDEKRVRISVEFFVIFVIFVIFVFFVSFVSWDRDGGGDGGFFERGRR